jgi:diadenosine tetraphosphatase ApaH/serine/threonine PP2A family protein phosphatase
MAQYALISDIHGNIDALRAVFEHIRADADVEQVVCLGDIIGYCPGVNEVIEQLAALEETCPVRYNLGSHDGAALGKYQFIDLASETDALALREAGLEDEQAVVEQYLNAETRRFVPVRSDARNAMHWTIEHLTDDAIAFLERRLQPRLELEPGIISVHGSPRDPACEYVRNVRFARRCFESPEMDGIWICFLGHTHVPVVWRIKRSNLVEMMGKRVCMTAPAADFAESVQFRRTAVYLANVGSVGQPRDHDPRACYGRFDSETGDFRHVRVEYDIDAAAARVREAGFSERLAERLYLGE